AGHFRAVVGDAATDGGKVVYGRTDRNGLGGGIFGALGNGGGRLAQTFRRLGDLGGCGLNTRNDRAHRLLHFTQGAQHRADLVVPPDLDILLEVAGSHILEIRDGPVDGAGDTPDVDGAEHGAQNDEEDDGADGDRQGERLADDCSRNDAEAVADTE